MKAAPSLKLLAGIAMVLTATLTVAALAQSPPANLSPDLAAIKAAEDAATKVYLSCEDRAAKHLDDQRSDPATIAQGALSVCGKEFDATVEVFSRNYDN